MVNENKKRFLEDQFISLVKTIEPVTPGRWGKMNAQQMVEHVAGFFRISTNKLKFPFVTPLEQLPKYRAFLLSEKEFRENTKAPILPDEPFPVRFATMDDSVADLERQLNISFNIFQKIQKRKHYILFLEN